MCKLFAILFFGIIAKFTVNYKTSEERILVSVSGSCHFIKGKLTCVNPDYKCTIINGQELCIRNLYQNGDVCDKEKCKHCLAEFCLDSIVNDVDYIFGPDYLNYNTKVNWKRYLRHFSKETVKKIAIHNNIK